MSRKDIEETIIRPMRRLYLAPRHLRQFNPEDPDALDEAIDEYRQALEGYDRDTLERAWKKVRAVHEFSIWPTPACIVQAAELCLPRPRPPSDLGLRRQRAWEQAEEYTNNFMKRRQLAKLSRPEGWAAELRGYVQAAAWVQAQLIEGLEKEGIGLPSELMRLGSFRSSGEALAEFREAFAGPVARGEIDVRIPKTLIEQWKEAGRRRRGQDTGTEGSDPAEQQQQRFQGRGMG